MNVPINMNLYEKVKSQADMIYKKPSAYKSGYIVKEYKRQGGKYSGKKPVNQGLDRWYKEKWTDVGLITDGSIKTHSNSKSYPTYRPTKRINKDTPLIVSEINSKNLQEQIVLKQKIRGTKNLPPFIKK